MCGIAGFVSGFGEQKSDHLKANLQGMTEKLFHRGPDDSGTWIDPATGVGLGHRRLSIIDLSQDGHQPMLSRSGRYVLVFNGEIYNFKNLRLRVQGSHGFEGWRGASDTEVLLEAMACWGVEAALKETIGMFAFALWDCQERALYLGRDRMGEKPLYYGWGDNVFFFSSELKALKVHPGWKGDISAAALSLFVRFNYVPAPYSIYEGVFKLKPGSHTCIKLHDLKACSGEAERVPLPCRSYWSPKETALQGIANPFLGSENEAVDALDSLLRDAVRQQMVADVPLGAFLSGGIDSSTIVALMQMQSSVPVKTFTIGVNLADFNEAQHAKAVAGHLGTDHTELYVTPDDALGVIPSLAEIYDEPFADPSQIPTFLLSKMTRQHVTVSLSGDGGDELFGGYNGYFLASNIWNRFGWLSPGIRQGLAKVLVKVPGAFYDNCLGWLAGEIGKYGRTGRVSDKIKKFSRVLPAASFEELYLMLSTNWGKDEPLVAPGSDRLSVFTGATWGQEFSSLAYKMMYLDLISYLPDDILVKVDRAAMSVSLETRVPLLDHRVCEFAWRLPLGMKIKDGKGKWLLRQVLYRYVPKDLVERPKRGFDIPVEAWLRGPLKEWSEDLLNNNRLLEQGLFNPTQVQSKWKEHLSGKSNWQSTIWNLLMFQSWYDAQG